MRRRRLVVVAMFLLDSFAGRGLMLPAQGGEPVCLGGRASRTSIEPPQRVALATLEVSRAEMVTVEAGPVEEIGQQPRTDEERPALRSALGPGWGKSTEDS